MSPHVPLCRRTLKKSSQADIAALGDAAGVIHLARLIPARDKAEIRTNLTGSAKAGGIGQSGRDRPKRAGSSMAAVKARAVSGPTPGTVIRRRQTCDRRVIFFTSASMAATAGVSETLCMALSPCS